MRVLITIRTIALLGTALVATAGMAQSRTPASYPADGARGKTLAAPCIACHGIPGLLLGTPAVSVPMLGGQRPEVIFLAIRDYQNGNRRSDTMAPIAATLSEQDMRNVGAYLAAKGPQMPTVHDTDSSAHEKVHRDCTACHGESGMGVMPGVPVLTGQHADYLVHAMNAYRDGTRRDATMRAVAAKLTADEIRQLAEYFAHDSHLELSQ